jgi:hypothetical protein
VVSNVVLAQNLRMGLHSIIIIITFPSNIFQTYHLRLELSCMWRWGQSIFV